MITYVWIITYIYICICICMYSYYIHIHVHIYSFLLWWSLCKLVVNSSNLNPHGVSAAQAAWPQAASAAVHQRRPSPIHEEETDGIQPRIYRWHVYIYIYVYIHLFICTFMYIHIYIYMCVDSDSPISPRKDEFPSHKGCIL